MPDIKLLKVKLKTSDSKLEVEYKEQGQLNATTDKICENKVHPDLEAAIRALGVHLAIRTDYLPPKRSGDTEELEKFTVTGYTIGGKDEGEGVVITGFRILKYGGTVTLNTPLIRYEQEEGTAYPLIDDLITKVEKIEEEVKAYLFKGKKAPDPQTSMQFEEPVEPAKLNGNAATAYPKIPAADPDAMERVKNLDDDEDPLDELDFEEVDPGAVIDSTINAFAKGPGKPKKSTGRKRK